MIEVRLGELDQIEAEAAIRPVSSDFTPVTPAMRRFDDAAGEAVRRQCEQLGELPVGSAVITAGGGVPVDFIVHVAVRSATEPPTVATVRKGFLNALRRLREWDLGTVAVVPLGTGAGNLDGEESAEAMLPVLADHVRDHGVPRHVTIVVEDAYQESAFSLAVARHAGELAERT
jgi:O-acetyl-ADP-ribose deacetylase (regulator of RNase III)